MGLHEDLHPTWDIDERYIALIPGASPPHPDRLWEAVRQITVMLVVASALISAVVWSHYAIFRPWINRWISRIAKMNWARRCLSIILFGLEHYLFAYQLPIAIQALFIHTVAGQVFFLDMQLGPGFRLIAIMEHLVIWALFSRSRRVKQATPDMEGGKGTGIKRRDI